LNDDLAILQLEAGDLVAASAAFTETVRVRPTSAAARYNLGNVLLLRGLVADAESHFRAALTRDAHHGLAHQGLGLALRAQGRLVESLSALEAALRRLPDDADVNYNVGVVRSALGRFGPAIGAFQRALTVRPQWAAAQIELAWAYAVAPDPAARNPAESLSRAEQAAAAQRPSPHVLDVLAAAQAAMGRFEAAASTAQSALDVTDPTRTVERTAMAARLEGYRTGRPFIWAPEER
jgi:tetratricopeptide (TPR) repeat protein